MSASEQPAPAQRDRTPELVEGLLALGAPAYRLAVHVLGSAEGAEDVVQQAYLAALARLRSGAPPDDARAWFLRSVANAARDYLKTEARRKRREAAVRNETRPAAAAAAERGEMLAALRGALAALDEKYRLPVALCCQENLSQREAAAILDVPESTVSNHVQVGLARLREALKTAGYAAAPAAVLGTLAQAAPPVPATLAAALAKLVSGGLPAVAYTAKAGAAIKGTGAAAGSAAAKGGMAMKVIAGVVAAGVLAGAVAVVNGVGAGFNPAPATLASPPAAAPAEGKPAPINDYKGMQEREEVFEFTQKPAVKKEGDKWVITFASKGACDATVSILDKDGNVVRHLATGVLGKNAPYPFQQNSLAQKIEWDGLADDFKKAPDGCKVKVSLGLQPKFERNIASDPYFMQNDQGRKKILCATGADGTIYLVNSTRNNMAVRSYGKDGKYLRTVIPPAAAEMEKVASLLGGKAVVTNWGDKSLATGRYGPVGFDHAEEFMALGRAWATSMAAAKGEKGEGQRLVALAAKLEKCTDGAKFEIGPCPAAIPEYKGPPLPDSRTLADMIYSKVSAITVDYSRELVYPASFGVLRFDGKTGNWDGAWKAPDRIAGSGDAVIVGYDDLLYGRGFAGHDYGTPYVVRYTQNGQMVPFKQNRFDDPALVKKFEENNIKDKRRLDPGVVKSFGGALMLAPQSDANITCGLDVAPDGKIVASVNSRCMEKIAVFDRDGKELTDDAVPGILSAGGRCGDGTYLDRDGNLYAIYGMLLPDGQKTLEGVNSQPSDCASSLVKFRGLGSKYPVGQFHKSPPADALKLRVKRPHGDLIGLSGALWAYGGAGQQSHKDCNCAHSRFWLDRFARSWVPAMQVSSVMLLDSNGNRIARLGKYGNVDDTEADVKAGKDGLRFVWVRSVCASDTAMYVTDYGNLRILKAALSYAAEETVPLP